ncbi:hypothetical protein PAECIP112173_00493 [Paenibacillus sp. JJ-100]|nr:hypothetical protein PAECIP112173_00493 [Paenibacillus sp. JJ-100]
MTFLWENVVISVLLLVGVGIAAFILLNIIRKGQNKK